MTSLYKAIYVLNPNSNQHVTDGLDRALQPLRIRGGPEITCLTLADGPSGVQSQSDIDTLLPHLLAQAVGLRTQAAAFVVACFSDPGLYSLREVIGDVPILGIAETGVLTALTLGHRFGVISILRTSIPRHLRYFGAMGVSDRLAADLAIDMEVRDLADSEKTLQRMIETGRRLQYEHGADVIVMGCAGMAGHRKVLEQRLGIPVVEPVQATVAAALGRSLLAW
jgi:Asp/Glu/hydantoin racemase